MEWLDDFDSSAILFLTSKIFESCEENMLTGASSVSSSRHSLTESLAQNTFNDTFSCMNISAQMYVGFSKPIKKMVNQRFD